MRGMGTILALMMASTASAQVAVVNPGTRDVLDEPRLKHILLGQVTTWADGTPIVLVMSGDPISRDAVIELTGRDLDRLIRGWKRITFSGAGSMPVVTTTSDQALALVRERAGALAIVGVPGESTGPQVRVVLELKSDKP